LFWSLGLLHLSTVNTDDFHGCTCFDRYGCN
jgi:hypothetical protein